MVDQSSLTPRQQAWFQSVAQGLERETGRSLEDWAILARSCPETRHRARLTWLKDHYGLGQNRASLVLDAAFPDTTTPGAEDTLWRDPAARALFERLRVLAVALPDVVVGERKQFTAFSRKVQFAAARPDGAGLIVEFALPPAGDLQPVKRPVGSDRLTSQIRLDAPEQVDALADRLRQAWERS